MASSSATRCRIRIRAALPRVAVENRRQLGRTITYCSLSPSLSMLRSTAAYLLGATLPSAKYAVLQLVLPLVSAVVFAKTKPISSGNKPMPKPLRKEHAPTAQLLGSCSQGSLLFAFDFALLLECIVDPGKRVCSSVPAPLRTSSLGRTLYHYRKHPAQKRQSELGTQIHRDALTCHGLPRPPVIGFQVPAISCTITWIGIDFVLTFFTLLCQIIRRVQIPARPLLAQGIASNCIGLALGAFAGKPSA